MQKSWRKFVSVPGADNVAAEGTIESFLFGSAFNGFTAHRLHWKFNAAFAARWGLSNGWNPLNCEAEKRENDINAMEQENKIKRKK